MGEFDSGRCLIFPNQGQFHVLKYLHGLARAIERQSGRLFSQTRAVDWSGEGAPQVSLENGRTITAGSLVLATNYPLMSKMFAELPAYRTYAIGIEIEAGSVERALFWDTADPYHYVRTQKDDNRDVLIVGGEDHRTGQENDGEDRFKSLYTWAQQHFGVSGNAKFKWSGQFMETHDGLGFLGRYSDGEPDVYLITGDSGMGMTHGTIGAMIVADLITGKENPWAEVYDPGRIATQSVKEAVPEIVSSTVPYVDWVTGGDVSSVSEIKNGEGAIIRDGIKKWRSIATRTASCTNARPSAPTWAV